MTQPGNPKLALVQKYEGEFSQALAKLGPPKEGHVWLFRAEHLWDPPPGAVYPPDIEKIIKEARGRWYGHTVGGRFQHIDRYERNEKLHTATAVKISALEVPIEIAAACYMANVPPVDTNDDTNLSPLQIARSHSIAPAEEFFFPTKLPVQDISQISQIRRINRFLGSIEEHKRTFIEIPIDDYRAIPAEQWQGIGEKAEHDRPSIVAQLRLQGNGTNVTTGADRTAL